MIKIETTYQNLTPHQKAIVLCNIDRWGLIKPNYQYVARYWLSNGKLHLESYENCYGELDLSYAIAV